MPPPTKRLVVKLFLASPNDVVRERKIAEDVIAAINRDFSDHTNCTVELLAWEHVQPGAGRPQERINLCIDQCDLFVGILWKRWGSPAGNSSSSGSSSQAAIPPTPTGCWTASRRRQGEGGPDGQELGGHPARDGHHGRRDHAAEPDPAQARRVSPPERAGGGPAGSRAHRTLPVHDRVDHGPRHAPASPGRPQARHPLPTNAENCWTAPGKGQHYPVAGLNPLAAIFIYWNTAKLGEAVFRQEESRPRGRAGGTVSERGPGGREAEWAAVDAARGPGHDQAAGVSRGPPTIDVLPHVPGAGITAYLSNGGTLEHPSRSPGTHRRRRRSSTTGRRTR